MSRLDPKAEEALTLLVNSGAYSTLMDFLSSESERLKERAQSVSMVALVVPQNTQVALMALGAHEYMEDILRCIERLKR